MTELLFREDAYMRHCEAKIAGVNERGGIILDRTVFFATGGGQPGDCGVFEIEGADPVEIATTVHGDDEIVHVPAAPAGAMKAGTPVVARIDWDMRHRHMRMHTCLHLLLAVMPFSMTGGQIAADTGRIDFDIPDAGMIDKDDITAKLNELIRADYPVGERWITDAELDAQPDLVRTMSVQPPRGSGRIRLVDIGGGDIDLQPCGGTHVASTGEIGEVLVTKIEKKGRINRRVRVAFA